MKKITFIFAFITLLSMVHLLSASDFGLPKNATIDIPPASAPSASPLLAEYAEYYSALTAYSDKAFSVKQDSPDFYEAQAYGTYLRARLETLADGIAKISAADPCEIQKMAAQRGDGAFDELVKQLPAASCSGVAQNKAVNVPVRGAVSPKVSAELAAAFETGAQEKSLPKNEPIKAGYCQINYVKNGVPFLVQYDGFLKKGEVIITFDDGPGALTEEVAASMKAGGAQSLFFVLGRNLGAEGKKHIKAEAADGHFVGVHGYNHATANDKPFTAYTTEKILSDLGKVAGMISDATEAKPGFFRPPYGIMTPDALKAVYSQLNLVPVGWTIDTLDWSTKDPETLYQNTISMIQHRGKGIVLMHDIHPQSRTAAPRLLKWLAANGYKVVSPERLAKAYKGE